METIKITTFALSKVWIVTYKLICFVPICFRLVSGYDAFVSVVIDGLARLAADEGRLLRGTREDPTSWS